MMKNIFYLAIISLMLTACSGGSNPFSSKAKQDTKKSHCACQYYKIINGQYIKV